jgi:anti-sigma factor RsiW
MMRHLSDEAAQDLAEGGGREASRAHVAECPRCAARVEEARAGLALARRAEVPEPSPLYWEAMRRNVERRIAEDPRRTPRWAWLAPLAATAAAVAVVALTTGRTPGRAPSPEPVLSAWSALPPEDEDVSLEVLEVLAAATGDLGPIDEGQGVGAFVAGLSEEDVRALADTLRGQEGAS